MSRVRFVEGDLIPYNVTTLRIDISLQLDSKMWKSLKNFFFIEIFSQIISVSKVS